MNYKNSELILNFDKGIAHNYKMIILFASVAVISLMVFAASAGVTSLVSGSSIYAGAFPSVKMLPTLTLTPANGIYTNNVLIHFSISSAGGQVTASLYVNNVVVATTTSSNTYNLKTPGPHSVVLTSPATTKYLKNSIARTYNVIISNAIPALTYSNGNNIIFGSTDIITANCIKQSSSDICAIYYGAVQLSSGTGTTTYNAGLLGTGSYAIYANDLTALTNSITNTLVISKATPLITFPGFPSSHNYNWIYDTLTASIQTINNQVTATDYINSALITTFTTQNSIQEINTMSYTMVANSFATANYLAGTNTISYTIIPVLPVLTYSAGNAMNVGQTDTITANCLVANSLDACAIWYGSNQLSSGTGTATYNAGVLSTGNYSIYANDSTELMISPINTLTISNSIPTLSFSNGNIIALGTSDNIIANCTAQSINDNCAIWYSATTLGSATQLANGIGSVTYNAGQISAGNYLVYANDTADLMSSAANVLAISVPANAMPILTYSNGNNILVGNTDIITANCIAGSINDFCAIYYGSTQLANGIGTATYNAGLLGAGNYPIYANDSTDLMNSAINILVVSIPVNAIPTLSFSNGNRITVGSTDIITANCAAQSVNDNCTIWYSGIDIANGIGSTTYNAGLLAVGAYQIYANDLTDLQASAVNTLYVSNQMGPGTILAPANINYYVPITLTNNQIANTPAPFQQHIQINSATYAPFEANDLRNVEFFYGNGTIVPSWLEDNNTNTAGITDYWVKLSNGISAFGTVTIFMGFASASTNLFDGLSVGEAPQFGNLWGYNGHPYAQYDNGANVFTSYWNFAGRALPSGFTNAGSVSYSVNNGITINVFSSRSTYAAIQSIQNYGANNAIDFFGWYCGHLGSSTNYRSSIGFGSSTSTQAVLLGQEVKGQFDLFSAGLSGTTSQMPYQNCTQATYSVGYTNTQAFAQENYGIANTLTTVPTVSGPVQIQQQENLKMYMQWLRVRAVAPNDIMPSTTFGCITSASTNSCIVPTISVQSTPEFYNQNNNVIVYAPQTLQNDQVNLVIDGNTVATGSGSATFNIAPLSVGTHLINAFDANTGITTSMSMYVARSYSYQNITLPNYATFGAYMRSTLGIQLPVVSWNSSWPGIYYVDSSNNLVQYQFGNGIVTTIAKVTPLSHTWPNYQMISTLFWVVGQNKDRALFFGTIPTSTDLYLETVNLATGKVLMLDTGISASSTNTNAQADYVGNDIAQIVTSSGAIDMFNMNTGAKWSGGTLGFFEANNEYYVPGINSIINTEAGGSTSDIVEQWQLNWSKAQPTYTKVASFAFDSGRLINGVDGVVYDPTTSEIFFVGGWYNIVPSVPDPNGQFQGSYLIHVNSNGIITQSNETKFTVWPFTYDMNNMIHIGYSTTDGYFLGMRFEPTPNGFHPQSPTGNGRLSASAYTDSINPFVGGRSWIPIAPNQRWLFNTTRTASDGFSEFQYSNTNYGIAPLSATSLLTTNQITWFWNTSMCQFPN